MLVPDGRVFVGGGGYCGGCVVNHLDAEMYSPPYLFNADGSPAARPTISLSAATVGAHPPTATHSHALATLAPLHTT